MKNFTFKILIFCIVLFSFDGFSQCGSGTLTLNSQQAVDEFVVNYPGCTVFTGSLQISGSDISDLSPLSSITSIVGGLRLSNNPSLTSIQGLHNITNIGGDLELNGFNFPLVNLDGLASLQTVGGMLSVQSFLNLTSVQGLSNVTTVGGNFLIQFLGNTDFTSISLPNLTLVGRFNLRENNNLITVNFDGLETVGTTFHLYSNDNLVTANFPALEEVGSSYINDFQINSGLFEIFQGINLENLNLSSLHTIKGGIDFVQNNKLMDLGFQNLTTVLRSIRINSNPALTSIDGLSGLSGTLTNFSVIGTNISNLDALENITAIGSGTTGDLIINDNPQLTSLMGLSGITTINRNMEIHNNDVLVNLNGINTLSSINYGYLSIQDNAALAEINGLQNLTTVGLLGNSNGISIINNTALTNLDGLAAMTTLKGGVTIRNNSSLIDVSAINISSFPVATSSGFYLENNDSLTNLTGMSIQSFNGQIQILGNELLQAIDFTIVNPSVASVLLIDNNPALQSLIGLGNITEINGSFGGFRVINNDSLQSLNGLNFTSIIGNYLLIKDNQALTNIDGLASLLTVSNDMSLEIINNASLVNLDGLQNLIKVGRILIQNNPFLIHINGLSGVTQLTMTSTTRLLSIFNNANLESIQGIRNIVQTSIFSLVISTNPMLAVCDLKNICQYLGTAKPRSINGNQSGCNTTAEVVSSCPTIWNGTSWSDGFPSATRSALIEGNLDLTTTLSAKNFTVNSGVFRILSDASLTLDGSVINNLQPENFIVENDGNLFQTIEASLRKNQGKIKVISENPPFKRLDYTLWSSPVQNQNLFEFSPLTINGVTNYVGSTGRIYSYEGINGYVNPTPYTQNAVFIPAKGYLFRAPNNWNPTVAVAYQGQFFGIPNNGTQVVTTHLNAFTSIGNPYPSTIDAIELFDVNPNLGALYFWTNTNAPQNGAYTQNNYASYTAVGGVAANAGGVEPTNFIAVGQGFIAYNGSTQVTFNNSMRVGNSTNFFRTTTAEKHRFWLNLQGESNVNHNQILVSYMTGATNEVDNQIDGKLFGYNGSSLYNVIENEKYAIQGKSLPFLESDVVLLGFKAENSGTFTISLGNFDGLFSEGEITIYLKDNLSNTIHNLMQNPYEFQSNSGEFNSRFEVVYQSTLDVKNQDLNRNLLVFKNQQNIVVQSSKEFQKIEIHDMLGRLVYKIDDVNSKEFSVDASGFSSQILIVSVKSESETTTRKIIN